MDSINTTFLAEGTRVAAIRTAGVVAFADFFVFLLLASLLPMVNGALPCEGN